MGARPHPLLDAAFPDRPPIRVYGTVLALLAVVAFASTLVQPILEVVAERAVEVFDRQLVGTVVYGTAGLATVAAVGFALDRRGPPEYRVDRHVFVQVVGAVGLICYVGAYVLHGSVRLTPFPVDVVSAVLSAVVAMALLALAVAARRDVDVEFAVPDGDARPLIVLAGLVALALGWASVVAHTYTGGRWDMAPVLEFGPRALTVGTVLGEVLVPAVFVGVATAILYMAVIQPLLAEHLGATGAVAAVTAIIVARTWTIGLVSAGLMWAGLADGPTVTRSIESTARFAASGVVGECLAVLVGALAAAVLARVTAGVGRTVALEHAAGVGFLVATVPIAALSIWPFEIGALVGSLFFGVVAALAAVWYERSGSVWVPTAALVAYQIVTTRAIAGHLAQALG